MAVSQKDREHFRRIGAYKALSHAESLAEHLAASVAERLDRSWQLYLRHREELARHPRDDDPTPFYDRARALGLYTP